MAKDDIENIDDLFSDALVDGAGKVDAFGNPDEFEELDDLGVDDSEDGYVVLDSDTAFSMFDQLEVIDDDEDDEDEEEVSDEGEIEIESRKPRPGRNSSGSSERKGQRKSESREKEELPSIEGDGDDDVDVPDWVVSLRSKLLSSVAHAFLLSGNVRDYMVRNITIKDGLVKVLDPTFEKFDVIAEYDQAHGLSFYGTDIETDDGELLSDVYRERFIEQMNEAQRAMSLDVTSDIPNKDPVLLFTVMSYLFDRFSDSRAARLLLFIDYSDFLVPDASAAQMKPEERKLAITLADIGRSSRADDAGNCLVFLTDDVTQLSTRIRSAESRIEHIKIPIPNLDERTDFIENVLDVEENTLSDGTQIFEHPESIDKNTFAINTAGLSRIQIEDIMLRSLCDDEPLSLRLMKERKNDIIHEDYDDVLEIIDPAHGFERIGGLDHLKNFFREEIIEPIHAGELEAVPMGVLLCGPPGTSKPIPVSTFLPTPDGGKLLSELKPGDKIFGLDGKPYNVLGITPKGRMDVYQMELSDGRVVRASGDHPFEVRQKAHGKWRSRLYTMEEMIEKGIHEVVPADLRGDANRTKRAKFHMMQSNAIEYSEKNLPLDPYVMGVFLGDGCKNKEGHFLLSSDDPGLVRKVSNILSAVTYRKANKNNYSWKFYREFFGNGNKRNRPIKVEDVAPEYAELLRNTLCHNKYIPDEYKHGSIEQRFALVQGLMDTDGCIVDTQGKTKDASSRFNMGFCSTSLRMTLDFMEIVYSLGYSCSLKCYPRKGRKIPAEYEKPWQEYSYKHDVYEVQINIPNEEKYKFFRLKRKLDIAKKAGKCHKRRNYEQIPIRDIYKTGETEEMACILTDAPDHLFLVENCVPTHNTFLSKAVAHEANMNFVALNLNRIMEKWVGSTERNLDRALDCAMAMAPTIIFIDEIDEALPNRADPNQSAVNKRINQRLLTFFSQTEHRGQVMILAATNYPEKVDPAFKRAGRFDMRLPMFAPDEFDRMRIMLVIAKSRGYTFSWFEDPDKIVANPFSQLRQWLEEGNIPVNEKFVGDRDSWFYKTTNALGAEVKHEVFLPKKLIAIIDKEEITLQQLYENIRILFEDMPERKPDASTGEIETDEVFFGRIRQYLEGRTDVIGPYSANMDFLQYYIQRWEMIYKPFTVQTFQMTGAELDVVMNKAIVLWRRFLRRNPGIEQKLIDNGAITDNHDIPWRPILLDACRKTVNAVAGIKLMEDNALLNTSDLDFIPDAMYAETDDGRQISYHERQEELVAGQNKSQLKKKN